MRTLLARTLAGLALSVTLASAALAVDSKDNAALRYWRAFSFLDESRELDALRAQIPWDRLGAHDFEPPQAAVDAVLKQRFAIQHGVRAASFDQCDFGIDYDLGTEALLPHLGSMRRLARDILLDARLKLDAGNTDDAIDGIVAALRSSHHVQNDRLVISALVSMAIFKQTEALLNYAIGRPGVTEAQRTRIAETLDLFDNADPFGVGPTILWEGAMMSEDLRGMLSRDTAEQEFAALIANAGDAHDAMREIAVAISAASAGREAEGYLRYYREAANMVVSNDAAGLSALRERVDRGEFGAMVKVIAPAFERIMRSNAEVRSILLDMKATLRGIPVHAD